MSDRVSLMGNRSYRVATAASGSDDVDFLDGVDTKGARHVGIAVWLGAFAYSATNKLKFTLKDSDSTTASTYADVDEDLIDGDPLDDGELFEQTSAVTAPGIVRKFNYKGSKRYLRIGMDETGTTTGAIVAFVELGTPREQPS